MSFIVLTLVTESYGNRETVTELVPHAEATDAFSEASDMAEALESSTSRTRDQRQQSLIRHLRKHAETDADCAIMLFQYTSYQNEDAHDLLVLGCKMIQLAKAQLNFHAEVSGVYALARFVLDSDPNHASAVLDLCTSALGKLRGGMDAESLYDMWCLVARSAEVLVMSNQPSFRKIEIKAYQQARIVARKSESLRNNYFSEARLLVLLIGDQIGSQQNSILQAQVNAHVRKIVDDLQPLKILEWIDEEGYGARDAEMQMAETVAYISLCMIHGFVPDVNNIKMKLFKRAERGGTSKEILSLWL